MQRVYLLLCVLGTVLPFSALAPWLGVHGPNLLLLAQHALATPVSAMGWWDVVLSGVTLLAFVLHEGRRLGMRRPWLALCGLGVGVSLALPLFLWLRERHLARQAPQA